MNLMVNNERLEKMFKSFNIISAVQISVFDRNFVSLISEKDLKDSYNKMSPFCAYLRRNKEFLAKCENCDAINFARVSKTLKPSVYTCHAGLREIIAPIVHENALLGYIMFGQFLSYGSAPLDIDMLRQYCDSFFELKRLIKTIVYMSKEEVEALLDILSAYSVYLAHENLVVAKIEEQFASVKDYIDQNIKEKLTAKSICQELDLSKSMLYKIVSENAGLSLGDYILECRINLAKDLLADTSQPIGEIAFEVGVYDYSYFSKVFSKQVGVTPSQYRKQYKTANKSGDDRNCL